MADRGDRIHQTVRERYGAFARQSGRVEAQETLPVLTCCEGGGCDCAPALYDVPLLEDLPADIAGLSLGCGDPVTIAGLRPGDAVLDLGSGAGLDCFLAARQVGESGQVIGVDMTPDMIARAEANRARLGLANVEFRQGQIEALPVQDSSIDVILSNCVINLSPDKAAVFREAYRVLKPGGRVAISDIVTQGSFSDELRADLSRWAECVTGAIEVGEYIRLMQEAGFVDIKVVDKASAEPIIRREEGMPALFSARITAHKPA
ncbi:MAG: arsenite methyltransferase [Anaerolineae bacterium]